MKHNLKIILILVSIFFIAQVIGLGILTQYVDIKTTYNTGETTLNLEVYEVSGVMPPPIEDESFSFIWIISAVLIGTILVLLIVKFKKRRLWKVWFFLSVVLTLIMAFVPFLKKIIEWLLPIFVDHVLFITIVIAGILAYYKVFHKNILIHNFTELFIYGGLASIIAPILNLVSASILLILISGYDMYAVWHSKHMVAMAEFQTKDKVFAGLLIPYNKNKQDSGEKAPKMPLPKKKNSTNIKVSKKIKTKIIENKNAILGGGDIAFPLLFAGAVMKYTGSFFLPLIISITSAITLFLLFYYGKNDRYYPAMPFLSTGCFVGAGIIWIITLF
jgi:presenilin-like A22 family membrane protease